MCTGYYTIYVKYILIYHFLHVCFVNKYILLTNVVFNPDMSELFHDLMLICNICICIVFGFLQRLLFYCIIFIKHTSYFLCNKNITLSNFQNNNNRANRVTY